MVNNNEAIIQWLFIAVLTFSVLLLGLKIFGKSSLSQPDALSIQDLQETLKNALAGKGEGEKASSAHKQKGIDSTADEGSSAAAGSNNMEANSKSDSSGADSEAQRLSLELNRYEEITQKLKTELEAKQKLIEDLQTQGAEGGATKSGAGDKGSGASGEELSALQKKLSEMEAKLAEYEILEDDIADLSQYKEENKKLKAELETLKVGGDKTETVMSEAPVESAESTEVAESAESTAPVEAAASEESIEPTEPIAASESLESAASSSAEDGEALVEEFAAAADVSKKAQEEEMTSDAENDLLAEFAQEVQAAQGENKVPTSDAMVEDEGNQESVDTDKDTALDTEKMLEEMADLSGLSATETEASLEEDVDTDKMAEEAAQLKAAE